MATIHLVAIVVFEKRLLFSNPHGKLPPIRVTKDRPVAQQNQVVVVLQSNGLGTAGFVVSLISFFCCGLSSPLGLLMSLIALIQPPRGMAFAGVILGALGSWWLFAFGLAMIGGVVSMNEAAKRASERQAAPSDSPTIPPAAEEPTEPPPIQLEPEQPPTKVESKPRANTPVVPVMREEKPATNTPPVQTKLRTWHSATGTFSTEAEFMSLGNGVVKLRKTDGTEISVPIDKLSEEDRTWIINYRRGK